MMATAAVIGLSAGKRLLSSSYYSDLAERFSNVNDHGSTLYQSSSTSVIIAKKSSNYGPSVAPLCRNIRCLKALKEQAETISASLTADTWFKTLDDGEEESSDFDSLVETHLLLQKSMLEKQWNLSFESDSPSIKNQKRIPVTFSGVTARQRRMNAKRKNQSQSKLMLQTTLSKQLKSVINPELLQNRLKGYVKGVVSEELLTHAEVVRLSRIIRAGLSLEDHKSRLKDRLGCEPSDEQVATSLSITRAELQAKLIECSLARERLAMSNVRLVLSVAQRYENMGAELPDLVQGGLIGLLRGIEKFDSSKGFKISTYVYWWIRQGVSRALFENSRMLRLPCHLHERLGLIRNAKNRLKGKGVTPSIDKIAENLNMSQKKVRNATEAVSKIYSLDREAFPSLNGLPGETHHSYIADNCLGNNPWHGVDEWALKEEVNNLIDSTLREREREIIRLYYGLDTDCLTWEDISKGMGLSRERVRQVGLVALEKLKHAARKRNMEAMLVKH
nr:plastidic RNA polymerase sigma-subunit 1 [Passiflora oerstedii]